MLQVQHFKYQVLVLQMEWWFSEEEQTLVIELFTNKIDIFNVDQTSDNDRNHPINKYNGTILSVVNTTAYNITSSSISASGSTYVPYLTLSSPPKTTNILPNSWGGTKQR